MSIFILPNYYCCSPNTHFSSFPSIIAFWTFPAVRKLIIYYPGCILYLYRQETELRAEEMSKNVYEDTL